MQDLTLGYRLPERWAGALGFASARFYGSARNLFTITDYNGYSPDVNSNGASNNAPASPTWARCPASVWAPTSTPIRWPAPSPSASRPPGSRHHARELRDDYPFRLRLRAGGVAGGLQLHARPGPGGPVAGCRRHHQRPGRAGRAGRRIQRPRRDDDYYGEDFVELGDLPADNADNTGTSQSYADADANQFRADNATAEDIWDAIYDGINRANIILERVPAVTDLDDTEKNEILGEAHFLRALHYHNLVKLYGDVPIRLTPVKEVNEAGGAVRSPVADVYTQILADLGEAGTLITATEPTTQATPDAVAALTARVQLYRQDYAAAVPAADVVIDANYSLAPALRRPVRRGRAGHPGGHLQGHVHGGAVQLARVLLHHGDARWRRRRARPRAEPDRRLRSGRRAAGQEHHAATTMTPRRAPSGPPPPAPRTST